MPNTPVQRRALSCQQLIGFDERSGEMRGDWARQMDNLAQFVQFESAASFTATFYVATFEEYTSPQRKMQRAQVAEALRVRSIPVSRVEFEVPDPHSFTHYPRRHPLPHVVISAAYTFGSTDLREPPRCR